MGRPMRCLSQQMRHHDQASDRHRGRRRQFRRRSLLLLLPMAMIVLGASPSRTLSLPSFRGNKSDAINGNRNQGRAARTIGTKMHGRKETQLGKVPFGPVPRGGSLRDIRIYNYNWDGAGVAAVEPSSPSNPLAGVVHGVGHGVGNAVGAVRWATRSVRRRFVKIAVGGAKLNMRLNVSSRNILSIGRLNSRHNDGVSDRSKRRSAARKAARVFRRSNDVPIVAMETVDTIDGLGNIDALAAMETITTERISSYIKERDSPYSTQTDGSHQNNAQIQARVQESPSMPLSGVTRWIGNQFKIRISPNRIQTDRASSIAKKTVLASVQPMNTSPSVMGRREATSFRRKGADSPSDISSESPTLSSIKTTASSSMESVGLEKVEPTSWVIETPLFPVILPKSWEPPTLPSSESTGRVMEIEVSVAMEDTATVAEADVSKTVEKPSPQLLQAATMPLIPKEIWESFTGNEFNYPETIEVLAKTGLHMAGDGAAECGVEWSGEKKTIKFLEEYSSLLESIDDDSTDSETESEDVDGIGVAMKANRLQKQQEQWYQTLDSSQEVLVWVGKFASPSSKNGYGADLPIIKTTSIIHKSPKYLAELLMDSEKVKIYNKMSLGRTDEMVFQKGVDSVSGSFGDGESKVVRNLTKPPMVKSLLEFVTCMHARKLRQDDADTLFPNQNENGPLEGYVVVSRAVTGGKWSADNSGNKGSNGEQFLRNEILLGVNVLKEVPGEPDKTELTAVTHVYSPLVPMMLAKSAGVKGAIDFVKDVRAVP